MRILVSNDDGISSVGIKKLALALKKYGEVVICAPDSQRSAASQSLSLKPIEINKVEFDTLEAYSCSGTPTDCVLFALKMLGKFDIVFSGVNNGYNVAYDLLYSGTFSAAREAIVHNIPGVALSCDCNYEILDNGNLDKVIKLIMDNNMYSKNYTLNVNFPNHKYTTLNGVKITEMGKKGYVFNFEKVSDNSYKRKFVESNDIDTINTDNYAVNNGYVSISALKPNYTDIDETNKLRLLETNGIIKL